MCCSLKLFDFILNVRKTDKTLTLTVRYLSMPLTSTVSQKDLKSVLLLKILASAENVY